MKVILVVVVFFQTASSDPIISPKNEVILSPGETLSLTCTSKISLPLWNLSLEDSFIENRITIFKDEIVAKGLYFSTLTLKDVSYLDTGSYRCQNERGVTSEAYLYVDDPHNLIDFDRKIHYVNIYRFKRVVLPCRPTHPSVKFRFFQSGMDITDNLISRLLSYNMKEGLIVLNGSLSYHSGQINCVASRNGVQNELMIILFFKEIPDVLPAPRIELKTFRPVEGENATLICKVSLPKSVFHVNLNWNIPSRIKDRVVIGQQKQTKFDDDALNEHFILYRDLSIFDLKLTDNDNYECLLKLDDDPSLSEVAIYKLQVFKKSQRAYISDPLFRGDSYIFINKKKFKEKEVHWIFDLEAYPDPIYSLVKPTGEIIPLLSFPENPKYYLTIEGSKTKKFLIFHPVLDDTGMYTLNVKVKRTNTYLTKNISLTFGYIEEPRVHLQTSKKPGEYFVLNSKYNVSCVVRGYPLDLHSFYFLTGNSSTQLYRNPQPFQFEYNFTMTNITINNTDSFSCRICSSENTIQTCKNDPIKVLPAESIHGHTIVSEANPTNIYERFLNETVTENIEKTFTFTCIGSILKFESLSWWYRKQGNYISVNLIEMIQTENFIDTLAIKSKIELPMSNSSIINGEYECRGTYKNVSNKSMRRAKFRMLPVVLPRKMNGNNMNGSQVTLNASETFKLNCETFGRPPPKVRWYKGGRMLNASEDTAIDLDEDILLLKYSMPRHEGKYTCEAKNRAGIFKGYKIIWVNETETGKRHFFPLILGAIILIVVLSLTLISLFLCRKAKFYNERCRELSRKQILEFENGDPNSVNPDLDIQDQAHLLSYDKEKYEFPIEKLKFGAQIGSGEFGSVKKAVAHGIKEDEDKTTVAVKTLKPNSDDQTFKMLLDELKIMAHLGKHDNIVSLLGAVTAGLSRRNVLMIVEFCKYGSLRDYLNSMRRKFNDQMDPNTKKFGPSYINHDGDCVSSSFENFSYGFSKLSSNDLEFELLFKPEAVSKKLSNKSDVIYSGQELITGNNCLSMRVLLDWAMQISNGMEYLSCKKVIHRDLACRNILLAEDYVIKICDFGLSKNIYRNIYSMSKDKRSPLPIKWLPIESLKSGEFTVKSDIWSFGIVMWEMFSLGDVPYPMIESHSLLKRLEEGYRMEKPLYCPDSLYLNLMLHCWNENPEDRPSFSDMKEIFHNMIVHGIEPPQMLPYSYRTSEDEPKLEDAYVLSENINSYKYQPSIPLVELKKDMTIEDVDGYLIPKLQ